MGEAGLVFRLGFETSQGTSQRDKSKVDELRSGFSGGDWLSRIWKIRSRGAIVEGMQESAKWEIESKTKEKKNGAKKSNHAGTIRIRTSGVEGRSL